MLQYGLLSPAIVHWAALTFVAFLPPLLWCIWNQFRQALLDKYIGEQGYIPWGEAGKEIVLYFHTEL